MTNDIIGAVVCGLILIGSFLYLAYQIGRAVERDEALTRAKRMDSLDRIYRGSHGRS